MKKTPYKIIEFDEFNQLVAEMQSLVEDVNELRAENERLKRRLDLIDYKKQKKVDMALEKYKMLMKQHKKEFIEKQKAAVWKGRFKHIGEI